VGELSIADALDLATLDRTLERTARALGVRTT